METTELLDTYETAKRLRLAVSTLAKMRLRGNGPRYRKIGAKVVYDVADIAAWLADRPVLTSTADGTVRRPRAGRPASV